MLSSKLLIPFKQSRFDLSSISDFSLKDRSDCASRVNCEILNFCSYCACASSYNAIVLMDRVDFTRAFGDLLTSIDFLGAR